MAAPVSAAGAYASIAKLTSGLGKPGGGGGAPESFGDLVKQAKAKGEDARVSVRNIRRKAMGSCTASRRTARRVRTR